MAIVSSDNIFSLPHLEQGDFVKANNSSLAIFVGNKQESEIVSPESKIRAQTSLHDGRTVIKIGG